MSLFKWMTNVFYFPKKSNMSSLCVRRYKEWLVDPIDNLDYKNTVILFVNCLNQMVYKKGPFSSCNEAETLAFQRNVVLFCPDLLLKREILWIFITGVRDLRLNLQKLQFIVKHCSIASLFGFSSDVLVGRKINGLWPVLSHCWTGAFSIVSLSKI